MKKEIEIKKEGSGFKVTFLRDNISTMMVEKIKITEEYYVLVSSDSFDISIDKKSRMGKEVRLFMRNYKLDRIKNKLNE